MKITYLKENKANLVQNILKERIIKGRTIKTQVKTSTISAQTHCKSRAWNRVDRCIMDLSLW